METLTIGWGGWIYVRTEKGDFRVRVQRLGGRFTVIYVGVGMQDGVTQERLREVATERVEALLNHPAVAPKVEEQLGKSGPAGLEGLTAELEQLQGSICPPPADFIPHVVFGETGQLQSATGLGRIVRGDDPWGELLTVSFPSPERSYRLEVPTDRRWPDAFYRRVVGVFTEAAAVSRKPAHLLAEANGVPVRTVHRWIYEARRRGLFDVTGDAVITDESEKERGKP